MSFSKYQDYKHSGVDWTGEVPSHWAVQSIKRHARLLTEKTDRRDHPVALENIEGWTGRFLPTDTEFEGEGVAFENGDILFGKLRPYLAKTWVAELSGEAVGDFLVMRPANAVNPHFLGYQLRSRETVSIIDGATFGSKMPRASWDFVGAVPLTVPPVDEQQKIVTFLDHETAKIDALVEEQQRLIELLQEKRQAVISHAVTKGLDPSVPMKDSGVEWIGKIPQNWGISQSRRMFQERNEKAKPEDRQLTASQKHGVIFQTDFMELENQKVVLVIHGAEILKHVEPNDFVISMRSFQGGLEWSGNRGSISSAYVMLIPGEQVAPSFFKYLFKSKSYIQALQATSNLVRDGQAMRFGNFVQVPLPMVPLEEQKLIANYLDKELAKFDDLIEESSKVIEILQERRAALISAAVTGKIDVRNWKVKEQKEEVPA